MDYLRQGIGLQGYAQKNPKIEYKRQSFMLFEKLLDNLKYQTIRTLSRFQVMTPEQKAKIEEMQRKAREEQLAKVSQENDPKKWHVGRNDPCPCGSGKKFKNCHGRNLR